MTKRICGSCRMCCKVLTIPDFAGKPDADDWCSHACNKGCAIYPQRPQVCRDFNCMWLLDQRLPDYWFPAKSKIVINFKLTGDNNYVGFVVDPAYPTRWREEPWFSDIKKLARAGLTGSGGQKWTTIVLIGDDKIPIAA
jgi:uncharacterized protein